MEIFVTIPTRGKIKKVFKKRNTLHNTLNIIKVLGPNPVVFKDSMFNCCIQLLRLRIPTLKTC